MVATKEEVENDFLQITLEDAIAYIQDDELVEVTPKSIRLRKRWLDVNMRKRMAKSSAAE